MDITPSGEEHWKGKQVSSPCSQLLFSSFRFRRNQKQFLFAERSGTSPLNILEI